MYTEVGRNDDAAPLWKAVVAHDQAEVDAGVRHPKTLLELAGAYAWLGNIDSALEILDLAIDYGAWDIDLCCEEYLPQSDEWLPGDNETRWWYGLEDDPRFIQSQSRMRSLVEMQRMNIRALLAQNDMEALVAPLIEPVMIGSGQ